MLRTLKRLSLGCCLISYQEQLGSMNYMLLRLSSAHSHHTELNSSSNGNGKYKTPTMDTSITKAAHTQSTIEIHKMFVWFALYKIGHTASKLPLKSSRILMANCSLPPCLFSIAIHSLHHRIHKNYAKTSRIQDIEWMRFARFWFFSSNFITLCTTFAT